jgi:hypothetical protein
MVMNFILGGVVEPIYENVPLPWVSDGDGPRSRAASIQSAPEMRAHDSSGPQLNLSQASTMTSSAHERLNPNMSIGMLFFLIYFHSWTLKLVEIGYQQC